MKSKSLVLSAGLFGLALTVISANAAVVTSLDFNSPIVTGPTQAPGTFYTDRYAPAGFAAIGGELLVTISSADSQSNRPGSYSGAFYSTQGRKYDLAPGAKTIEAELFVNNAWVASGAREAGLWGTAFDSSNTISFYPIMEYAFGGFRGWDGAGGWLNFGAGVAGAFNTIGVDLDTDLNLWHYKLNGTVVGTLGANGSEDIRNAIFQAHNNYGVGEQGSKQVRWDNFVATDGENSVPEPSSLALMPLAFFGLALATRRRDKKALTA